MNANTKANLDRIKIKCNYSLEIFDEDVDCYKCNYLEPNPNINSYFSQRLFYCACTM